MRVGAGDQGAAGLDGLPKRLQRRALEFRELIEKEHAVVREADLSGLGAKPAADQRGQRGGVMRVAEWAPARQLAVVQEPGDRMNHADFQRLGRGQRRQQARQALRQHRLARSRRADHQQVVAASGRDLERALRRLLALDVGEVERGAALLGDLRLGRREHLASLEVVDQRQQRRRRQDLAVRPRRLAAIRLGADEAAAFAVRRDRRRQHARDRGDLAVERELAQGHKALHLLGRQHAHRQQEADRDRQVEVAAFLEQVGRRQVHGDPFRRQRQAEGVQRPPHSLATLGHGLVGESHQREGRQAPGDLHLDVDRQHLDAAERHRPDARNHLNPVPGSRR